jgi:hypothetical protein
MGKDYVETLTLTFSGTKAKGRPRSDLHGGICGTMATFVAKLVE